MTLLKWEKYTNPKCMNSLLCYSAVVLEGLRYGIIICMNRIILRDKEDDKAVDPGRMDECESSIAREPQRVHKGTGTQERKGYRWF